MTDEPDTGIVDVRPDETTAPAAASEACAIEAAAPARAAMPRDLPRIMTRIFGTPLLIAQEKLDVILAALGPRLGIAACPATNDKEADLIGALIGLQKPDDEDDDTGVPYTVTDDGIALIGIDGTLVYKSSWLGALSGLMSYADIRGALDKAMADPAVKGVLLAIDSYGGEVNGSFDLSDAIFAARQKKPITGVAADDAYSAGYLLLSACSTIHVSRTSGVGSVGVVALHVDQSAYDRERGLKYSYVFSGAHKIDLNPHQPMSDPAREALQGECDRLRGLFAASVARYRGLSVEAVLATEAACFYGEQAVGAHFADAVGTPSDALAVLRDRIAKLASGPGLGLAAETPGVGAVRKAVQTLAEASPVEEARPAVIDFAAEREKLRGELVSTHGEIIELCSLAGRPGDAAAFIRNGASLDQVRTALQDKRAEVSDAQRTQGHILPDADTAQHPAAGWDTALAKARGQRSKQ
jgi:signal peptide peptidase SppA